MTHLTMKNTYLKKERKPKFFYGVDYRKLLRLGLAKKKEVMYLIKRERNKSDARRSYQY